MSMSAEALASSCASYSTPVCSTVSSELLVKLNRELANSLMLVAATGSIARSLARNSHGVWPGTVVAYLPPELRQYLKHEAQLDAATFPLDLAFNLRLYNKLLTLAKSMTLAFADMPSALPNGNAPTIAGVERAWVNAALSGVEALTVIFEALSPADQDQALQTTRNLTDSLETLINGGIPCLDAHGNIHLPGTPERRNLTRNTISVHTFLLHRGAIVRVLVTDASEKGLRVQGLQTAVRDDLVTLLIGPMRHVAGRVAWAAGNEAGLELTTPLPQSFLTGLQS